MAIDLQQLGNSLAASLEGIGTYSAKAANQANAISRQAQSAQGAFNQASANQANMLQDQSIQAQYGFNSAMMDNANQFTADMWNQAASYNADQWNKAADFNREMMQKQMDFNREMWQKSADYNSNEAMINRNFQQRMEATKYQRAVHDMSKAGLNPILAVTGGGISAGGLGGSMASTGSSSIGGSSMSPTSMSSAQGQMASGGLLGAHSAQESNYMGQMEYLSGTLGLISAVIGGLSSAADAAGGLGETGQDILENATDILNPVDNDSYHLKGSGKVTEGINKAIDWIKGKYDNYKDKNKEEQHQLNMYYNNLRKNSYWRINKRGEGSG